MVVTSNVPPEKNLYYLGGKVLEILTVQKKNQYDIVNLYNSLKENTPINFVLFTYVLDWLFLINLIKINADGSISKCF